MLALAGVAAWQLSGRHESPVAAASDAASAAASSVAAVPAPASAPVAMSPVIIEEAAPKTPPIEAAPTASGKGVAETSSAIGGNDTGPRSAPERAPIVDAASTAASAARVRPVGKPVPKVGDDASTTAAPSIGSGALRPLDSPGGSLVPAPGSDRSRPLPSPSPSQVRDPYAPARSAAPVEAGPQTIEDACGKLGFFARNVCFDERCEEARFRNTGVCPEVLARKARRGGR